MAPSILLHGSGAIGTIYLYLLHRAGHCITATARSNYDAVRTEGFRIDSTLYGKGLHFQPRIARTPSEAAEQNPQGFEYVIVTTKALPDARTAEAIRPAVTQGKTTVVLIQNGIGIEEEYVQAFPGNAVLSCVVYLPTTQVKPGHIEMGDNESLEIGSFPAPAYQDPGVKAAADQFVEMMQKAGSNARFFEDVQERRWKKLLLNSPWNPMCALTLSRDVAFLAATPEAESVVEEVMLEVVAVCEKLGYPEINAQAAKAQLKRATDRMGGKGIEPSMLVDVLWERRMEVETILGNPVKVAKKLGVSVPRMEMLYVLTKALDEAMALRKPGESLAGHETKMALGQQRGVASKV